MSQYGHTRYSLTLFVSVFLVRALFLSPFFFPYNLPRRRADMHGARKVPRELLDDKRESVGEQEGQAGGEAANRFRKTDVCGN